ncbi:MAG: hypothetical protein ACI9O6_003341 [Glaciecola sp.]
MSSVIIDLNDFDFHCVVMSSLNKKDLSLLDFSPMIIYLVCWAYEYHELTEGFTNAESQKLALLKAGDVSFFEFTETVLEGRLESEIFKKGARSFVKDYYEYGGYIDDLTSVFSTNIANLPLNLINISGLYQAINKSRINYYINKSNFPELIVFRDPEQLKIEQSDA